MLKDKIKEYAVKFEDPSNTKDEVPYYIKINDI